MTTVRETEARHIYRGLDNIQLNKFSPHLSRFYPVADKALAENDCNSKPGSKIVKIYDYYDSDVMQIFADAPEVEKPHTEEGDEAEQDNAMKGGRVKKPRIARGKFIRTEIKPGATKKLQGYLVQYPEALAATKREKEVIAERNRRLHREYTFTRTEKGFR